MAFPSGERYDSHIQSLRLDVVWRLVRRARSRFHPSESVERMRGYVYTVACSVGIDVRLQIARDRIREDVAQTGHREGLDLRIRYDPETIKACIKMIPDQKVRQAVLEGVYYRRSPAAAAKRMSVTIEEYKLLFERGWALLRKALDEEKGA